MPRKKSAPVAIPAAYEAPSGAPDYSDPDVFRQRVEQYFEACSAENVLPDEKGMYVFLDVLEEDLEDYLDDSNPNSKAYLRILKLARYKRESWLARTMVSDSGKASGCMNALKQEQNGGYKNTTSTDRKQRVELVLPDGMTMEMFK